MQRITLLAVFLPAISVLCGDLEVDNLTVNTNAMIYENLTFYATCTTNSSNINLEIGLIAHWKMNDNASNTNIVDSKGGYTAYALDNTDTLSVPGKINAAITNTANDYLFSPSSTNLSFDYYDIFSVSLWVKCSTISGTMQFISKNVSGGDSGFQIFNEGATALAISPGGWTDGTYEYFDQTAMQNIDDGNWHHLVIVYGGSKDDVTAFIDNVSLSPTRHYSSVPSGTCNNAQPIRLGGEY